ncbi:MAG: hypothetical protein L0H15_10370 [Nitrosospira sp.]|nr:hypothetical protein [Nitrosospira sp.]
MERRSDPRLPPGAGKTIPWPDPASGGIYSRALLLLQDPSEVATAGTGFISPDNNDPTAKNVTDALLEAGLRWDLRLQWNVYPWWVNTYKTKSGKDKARELRDPTRPRETWTNARKTAAALWGSFFELLPELRVIVVFGKESWKGWEATRRYLPLPSGVSELCAPSLSPPGYYSHCDEVARVLLKAKAVIE